MAPLGSPYEGGVAADPGHVQGHEASDNERGGHKVLSIPHVEGKLQAEQVDGFLKTMTYSDKTLYPFSSQNEEDFMNIMDIYLDAVFHPSIHNIKEIFMQEGWHYTVDDKDSELGINGVVYNEMNGAFSSPTTDRKSTRLNSSHI